MAHLFNVVPFPANSRMSHLWNNTWADAPDGTGVAVGHLIRLGEDQDVVVETDFLSSHMPFNVGGFGGYYPDGGPWMFIVQHAAVEWSAGLVREKDPFWALRDSLEHAIRFNAQASVQFELRWTRDELIAIYHQRGVPADALQSWPMPDLLRGLLAECCDASLPAIAAGYPQGCLVPGTPHVCESDVFSDAFARRKPVSGRPPGCLHCRAWAMGKSGTPAMEETDCKSSFVSITYLSAMLMVCRVCTTTWLSGYHESFENTPIEDEWGERVWIRRALTAGQVAQVRDAMGSRTLNIDTFGS